MGLIILVFIFFIICITSTIIINYSFIGFLFVAELIFLFSLTNVLAGGIRLDDMFGDAFGLVILTVAACESTVFLVLVVVFYKIHLNKN